MNRLRLKEYNPQQVVLSRRHLCGNLCQRSLQSWLKLWGVVEAM
jgi:hypothetical protein